MREKGLQIDQTIQSELAANQMPNVFSFKHPNLSEIIDEGRLDASIYDEEYKSKIWLIQNYIHGYTRPSADGFTVTPGPSLELKIIRTRIDSDTPKPRFYALIVPMNISEHGTMNVVPYLGTGKKLPLLKEGDIVFGEAGFKKGRSIVLMDDVDKCTTNAHGLYARRKDGDLSKSIFFRCIFNWYRSTRLIDIMAVGGSGGHFSPEYFDYIRIPKFPEKVREKVVSLYSCEGTKPNVKVSKRNFVEWHSDWNTSLGIVQLHREMKNLRQEINKVQKAIIEGTSLKVPLA